MKTDVLISLDLEMNQPSGKIIQIGWAVGNWRLGKISETGYALVDPGEPIREDIVKLTGITDERISIEGMPLLHAYSKIAEVHKRVNPWINSLTWGGGDSRELKEQLDLVSKDVEWVFGRRWIDAKTLYQEWRRYSGKSLKGGLATALTKCDMEFIGRPHDAMDDAINTFHIYRFMMHQWSIVRNPVE